MATLRERAEAALLNPNVQKALKLIQSAEGVQHGYNTGFGNVRFDSLDDHPRVRRKFTQTDGKENSSSAAGAYQFLEKTWDDVADKLKLTDFGPLSQDLGAIELMRRAGALNDVMDGKFAPALKKMGKTWASLPSSPYPQAKRSQEWIDQQLAAVDGSFTTSVDAPRMSAEATAPAPANWSSQLAQALNVDGLPQPVAQGVDYAQGMANLFKTLTESGEAASTPVADPAVEPLPDSPGGPEWLGRLAEIRNQERPLAAATEQSEMTPWEQQVWSLGLEDQADAERGQALASFFGEQYTPTLRLPAPLERTINSILATI